MKFLHQGEIQIIYTIALQYSLTLISLPGNRKREHKVSQGIGTRLWARCFNMPKKLVSIHDLSQGTRALPEVWFEPRDLGPWSCGQCEPRNLDPTRGHWLM